MFSCNHARDGSKMETVLLLFRCSRFWKQSKSGIGALVWDPMTESVLTLKSRSVRHLILRDVMGMPLIGGAKLVRNTGQAQGLAQQGVPDHQGQRGYLNLHLHCGICGFVVGFCAASLAYA